MITKWPRYSEVLLAVWLVISGWIVEHPDPIQYRAVSVAAGVAVIVLDAFSITLYRRYAYLLILAVAVGLIAFAFFSASVEAQGVQNLIVIALLLAMFAILPTEATLPPPSWRELNRRH